MRTHCSSSSLRETCVVCVVGFMFGMRITEHHKQIDTTLEHRLQTNCDTTLLADVVVPCALMRMLAAGVSILVQARAMCSPFVQALIATVNPFEAHINNTV